MNNILNRFRIPTILGLAVIVLGTVTGVYLVLQNQTVTSQATVDNTPQKVAVYNLTDSSATVTWQTATPIGSFLSFGVDSPNKTAVDDRDSGVPTPRINHIATITSLTPQTTYFYKLVAGKYASPILSFTTANAGGVQNNFKPVIGSVIDGNKPLQNGLVVLTIPGALPQVAPVKSLGNFIIPLGSVRKEGLNGILDSDQGIANLVVTGEDGRQALAVFNLNSSDPIGPLKMDQNLDLTKKPEQLGIQTNKFDLNNDGQVSTADYAIINKNLGKKLFDKKADLNGDNKIDKKDLDLILAEIKKNIK